MEHGAHDTLALNWYESGLPSNERKQRGHFSTPHTLVDQILTACEYTSHADLRHLRLLDPACGSGNFLARAALRLSQALEPDARAACIQRNLWGLDPDPVACFLAEMQVRTTLEASGNRLPERMPLHIHQADSLALSWQPCVDVLVANPPYLAAKNTDLSHYLQASRHRQADSYLLFLELALRAVRPGGWIGLVVPDPVLARANAAPERALLLRECTLHHLWHLEGVFAAEVGAVALVARKIPPHPLHRVNWIRARWQAGRTSGSAAQPAQRVGQALLASQPGTELRYLLSQAQGRTSERLRRALHRASLCAHSAHLRPLETLVDIKRGEEIGRASALLEPLAALDAGLPVLRGGIDLRPYATISAQLGLKRATVKKPLERYLRPKLLVVKSTERLQAALDTRGHVVLQTLYLLHVHADSTDLETSYFLLALLNSRLLNAYVYHLHTAYKLVQPQIEQGVLARLPVAWGSSRARLEIAERARALACACGELEPGAPWNAQIIAFYDEQERAISALYAQALSGISAGEFERATDDIINNQTRFVRGEIAVRKDHSETVT